jgi:hypothetical protein
MSASACAGDMMIRAGRSRSAPNFASSMAMSATSGGAEMPAGLISTRSAPGSPAAG